MSIDKCRIHLKRHGGHVPRTCSVCGISGKCYHYTADLHPIQGDKVQGDKEPIPQGVFWNGEAMGPRIGGLFVDVEGNPIPPWEFDYAKWHPRRSEFPVRAGGAPLAPPAPPEYLENFKDWPESVNERNGNRNWTPREICLRMLRDLDSGKYTPTTFILAWFQPPSDDEKGTNPEPNFHWQGQTDADGIALASYVHYRFVKNLNDSFDVE